MITELTSADALMNYKSKHHLRIGFVQVQFSIDDAKSCQNSGDVS